MIKSSDQVCDDTGLGLAADVVKTGAGILLVEESADRVRITAECLECNSIRHAGVYQPPQSIDTPRQTPVSIRAVSFSLSTMTTHRIYVYPQA